MGTTKCEKRSVVLEVKTIPSYVCVCTKAAVAHAYFVNLTFPCGG